VSRRVFFVLAILALIQFTFGTALSPPSQAQARTVDLKAQEEKIRQMVQYVYDRAYARYFHVLSSFICPVDMFTLRILPAYPPSTLPPPFPSYETILISLPLKISSTLLREI